MSLFASDELIKLYWDGENWVTDKATETFVEVKKELSAAEEEMLSNIFRASKVKYFPDTGAMEMDLSAFRENIPYEFLTRVIRGWSENAPITPEALRKIKAVVIRKLWTKLQELYDLTRIETAQLPNAQE